MKVIKNHFVPECEVDLHSFNDCMCKPLHLCYSEVAGEDLGICEGAEEADFIWHYPLSMDGIKEIRNMKNVKS